MRFLLCASRPIDVFTRSEYREAGVRFSHGGFAVGTDFITC